MFIFHFHHRIGKYYVAIFTFFYTMNAMTRLFPLWALIFSFLAWWLPDWFRQVDWAIVPLLAVIMFAMGLTLSWQDFLRVRTKPRIIVLGLCLQFGLMPLLAWLIAAALGLSPLLASGLILVGACSGGTASNVIAYLANGDVALSITLTAISTLLAVVMTPLLSWVYIDAAIAVPVWSMLKTILLLVIFPVLAGMSANQFYPRLVQPMHKYCPLVAMAAIVFIIAIVVALNHGQLGDMSVLLLLAVATHNLAGLGLGFLIARQLGHDSRVARTLAIEVGMQNSGLAVALALKNFAALAALPGAMFSIWHNISGSVFAAFWQWRDRNDGL